MLTARPMLMATLSFLLGACASMGREARLDELTRDHVYERPLAEVLVEVRAMLHEQRFQFREEDADGVHVVATDWLGEDEASAQVARWTRLLVIGKSLDGRRSTVHIFASSRTASGDAQWAAFTSWGKPNYKQFSAEAQDDSGVPREFSRAAARQTGTFRRAAGWSRSPVRDLRRERALLERVDPEAAHRLQELTGQTASSGAPPGGSPPGSSPR